MIDVKWIKIAVDIFDDEKILIIENLKAINSDSIIVIWFKLLALAGKQNNSGVFTMNNRIAYTDEMLAAIFRRDVQTIKCALNIFEQYGMVELIEGVITIPNWSKHQTLDKIESRNEYQKNYMKGYRNKQKLIACNTNSKTNSNANSKANVSAIEEELEGDKEEGDKEDKDMAPKVAGDAKAPPINYQLITETWNSLNLNQITKITTGSSRQKMLKCRVKEHTQEIVIEAIENIKNSDFLQGKTDKCFIITFDWFVKPNNFIKVLEGNYVNKNSKNKTNKSIADQFNNPAVQSFLAKDD